MVNIKDSITNNFVIALGYFDSVHIGHRSIISKTISESVRLKSIPAIITFDDNFLITINRNEKMIYTLSERIKIFNSLGIDNVIVISSNNGDLSSSPESFLKNLTDKYLVRGFVCGPDFRFGMSRQGDVSFIDGYSRAHGISLSVVDYVLYNSNEKVSSASIRGLITNGDLYTANLLLDSPFTMTGHVELGRQNGRLIGFPTANLTVDSNKIVPAQGVYSTFSIINNIRFNSITNIGSKPTYDCYESTIESHLIGFSGNLYDTTLTIGFNRFLRTIKKFDSPDKLKEQLEKDKSEALND
ncbi:MAG: riboflavin biosynthesis protein RibF [Christensenellaceae bacterium]|jgi:riboflavin kinase/FMN adenylyltransferase|nr:riboflavin biosynthesis protein RibF [Christensenellaceae bacterium]